MKLFKKPKNIRYVDMAIWIDNHAYDENISDDTLYEYLYHLVYMLAVKKCMFKDSKYYEDFAVESATLVYMRLKNPKQFEIDDNGNYKMERIKSILNYIKNTLYPMKVIFEQQNYAQVLYTDTDVSISPNTFTTISVDKSITKSEFKQYLNDIIKTCKTFLTKIPYFSVKKEWINIYISCLLSFLNSITISNVILERLSNRINPNISDECIIKLYEDEQQNSTIIFHLDSSMKDYITILTRRLRHILAKDLSQILSSQEFSEDITKQLLLSSIRDSRDLGDE